MGEIDFKVGDECVRSLANEVWDIVTAYYEVNSNNKLPQDFLDEVKRHCDKVFRGSHKKEERKKSDICYFHRRCK